MYVTEVMHNQGSSIPFKSNSNHKIERIRQSYLNYLYIGQWQMKGNTVEPWVWNRKLFNVSTQYSWRDSVRKQISSDVSCFSRCGICAELLSSHQNMAEAPL